jgi:hypothetical protein
MLKQTQQCATSTDPLSQKVIALISIYQNSFALVKRNQGRGNARLLLISFEVEEMNIT